MNAWCSIFPHGPADILHFICPDRLIHAGRQYRSRR